jgi:fructose-specific phosphotransferase system IIC component
MKIKKISLRPLWSSWFVFKDRPLRFRTIDVVLWWVLISLVAISFVGEHPIVTIAIAITGGAMIGVLTVLDADPL